MKYLCAILSVTASLFGPLMFGLSLGFSGQTIDTMQNTVTTTNGTHIQIGENSDLWIFKTSTEASLFGSLVTIGAMIGALAGGPITEKFGRKWTLIGISPLFVVMYVWMALAHTAWQLLVARVFVGVGVGVESFVVPTYIGEVSPIKLRGALGACNQLAVTIGILLAYVLGLAFPSQADSVDPNADSHTFCNWRNLCWIIIIPSALLGICMFFAPETPHWLASHGRLEAAKAALSKLRDGKEDGEEYMAESKALELTAESKSEQGGSLLDRFKSLGECKMQLFIGVMLLTLQQLSGINAIIFYQTTIFQEAGIEGKKAMALTVMAVQLVVTLISCIIMDKAGRRILLLAGAIGMCISAICMGIFFYLKDDAGINNVGWLAIVSAYCYIAAFSIGVGAIPWLIMAEIFPGNVRGLAASIATCVNWFCGFIVTMFLDSYRRAVSFSGVFWTFAGICACMIAFVVIFVPETKGKTFDQIQAYFKSKYKPH
ncbi:hypothetical protein FOL47_002532 [Perkinsus chesapeaki]|uniref:Hexose transporter 1 n=1 Tax=Perkinsus chesapeaki TaxID=330153 RepID=A0A7J6N0A5_PERCH|nr:hypothetical protein FOL47_002532 [Perkinsus chesapeaki]